MRTIFGNVPHAGGMFAPHPQVTPAYEKTSPYLAQNLSANVRLSIPLVLDARSTIPIDPVKFTATIRTPATSFPLNGVPTVPKLPHLAVSFGVLILLTVAATPVNAQNRETATVINSSAVLDEVMRVPAKGIPRSLFSKAHGIVIIPSMLKGGFVIVVCKSHDSPSESSRLSGRFRLSVSPKYSRSCLKARKRSCFTAACDRPMRSAISSVFMPEMRERSMTSL